MADGLVGMSRRRCIGRPGDARPHRREAGGHRRRFVRAVHRSDQEPGRAWSLPRARRPRSTICCRWITSSTASWVRFLRAGRNRESVGLGRTAVRPGNGSGAPSAGVVDAASPRCSRAWSPTARSISTCGAAGPHAARRERRGKSTLAAVMSGSTGPAGELLLDGRRVALQSRATAWRGIEWCISTSGSSNRSVAENTRSAIGPNPSCSIPRARRGRRRVGRAVRTAGRPARGCRISRSANGNGSNREDALPRRRDPAARRADRGAHPQEPARCSSRCAR